MGQSGHWRTLKPNQVGSDQFGSPVYGKTWVDRKSKKKPKPPPQIVFTPKSEPEPKATKQKKPSEIDLELWKKWKASGSQEDLSVLMHRFDGTVAKYVYMFRDYAVAESVIEATAYVMIKKAIETYNPNKGANLNSHVTNYVKKVGQVVGKYANLGRIPEHRRLKIPEFKQAKEELFTKLGHEPDAKMLATYLGWDIKEIARMETELNRRDLVASQITEPDVLEGSVKDYSVNNRVFRSVYLELDDEIERLVFE